MNFSVQTVNNKDRLLRFNNFVVLRKRFFWSWMIVCTVLITVLLAIVLRIDPYSDVWIYAVLVYFIDAIYIFCWFVLPRFTINKALGLNANIIFEFQEDTFKISATAKNGTEFSELNYSSIVKFMESKQDIYLFISKTHGYILDKSGFTVGSPEEFLKFLQEKNIPYKR